MDEIAGALGVDAFEGDVLAGFFADDADEVDDGGAAAHALVEGLWLEQIAGDDLQAIVGSGGGGSV